MRHGAQPKMEHGISGWIRAGRPRPAGISDATNRAVREAGMVVGRTVVMAPASQRSWQPVRFHEPPSKCMHSPPPLPARYCTLHAASAQGRKHQYRRTGYSAQFGGSCCAIFS